MRGSLEVEKRLKLRNWRKQHRYCSRQDDNLCSPATWSESKSRKQRVIPLYIDREAARWLEAAESLLLLFREGIGMTRGEIESEIDALFGGGGKATQVYRGLAKVLEDRAEFEVVADVPPDVIREKVFTAAADYRRQMRAGPDRPGPPRGLPPR